MTFQIGYASFTTDSLTKSEHCRKSISWKGQDTLAEVEDFVDVERIERFERLFVFYEVLRNIARSLFDQRSDVLPQVI